MQIRELISSGSFSDLRLLTGDHGLDTDMKDVVLLEYDSLNKQQEDYYNGDFIISTLYFAKDHPDLLFETVSRLIKLGASGLAFKSSYYKALPPRVKSLAQEQGFPIFMFDDLYIEDVILTISDYIRQRQEFSLYEDSLFKILSGTDSYNVEQLLATMNPNRQKYMNAAYVHAPDMNSEWSQDLRQALQLRNTRRFTADFRFLQFRRGFFILSNFTEPVSLDTVAANITQLLQNMGCPTDRLCIGISDLHQRSMEFDCVIREAFDALLVAIADNAPVKKYHELMLYQTIFPMLRDKSVRETMRLRFETLNQYDKESTSSCLSQTLFCHAEKGYDIKKTAAILNQHPNTIRYRLKKICDLTATDREAGHALFLMGEFHRMDMLANSIY